LRSKGKYRRLIGPIHNQTKTMSILNPSSEQRVLVLLTTRKYPTGISTEDVMRELKIKASVADKVLQTLQDRKKVVLLSGKWVATPKGQAVGEAFRKGTPRRAPGQPKLFARVGGFVNLKKP